MKTQGKARDFIGTYFSKDVVQYWVSVAKTLSWVVVIVYTLDLIVKAGVMILQIPRGFWVGMGFTDVAQRVIYLFE